MDRGTFLLLEGVVVALLVVARGACMRTIDVDSIPSIIRGRVLLGNRLTPVVTAVAAAMVLSGAVLTVLSW